MYYAALALRFQGRFIRGWADWLNLEVLGKTLDGGNNILQNIKYPIGAWYLIIKNR